ncbi:MAG: hypothetical protein K9N09_09280 [Candidatus Cloacimonetes bacterium]|nr:hypothetical protein [Candidatus Cloacimonadota bacterium]MCF7814291.1 hypothetical protein [Candidatus Cloacimonadota bacterium]MCF7868880.1 hypothetical protein [Candidatus Cloacimonadota bacterium]MCF7884332.1 hypothetical protein [Candidatus Cloacimonadota bacterium]
MKKLILVTIILFQLSNWLFTEEIKNFSDPQKYGWDTPEKLFTYREDLVRRQKLLQLYDLKKQEVATNMLRSSLIPGWGQYSAHRYTKGQIIFISELCILAGSYLYYREAMDNFDKYKEANYIGDINKYYKKAQDNYDNSQYLLGAGLVLWLLNIYDSIGSTEAFNNDTWFTLYENETNRISLEMNGVSFKF